MIVRCVLFIISINVLGNVMTLTVSFSSFLLNHTKKGDSAKENLSFALIHFKKAVLEKLDS